MNLLKATGMTIKYHCDQCGVSLKIKDELAGTPGHCPKCHVEFTVPALPESDEQTADHGADDEREASGVDEKAAQPATAAAAQSEKKAEKSKAASGFSEDDIESILLSGDSEKSPRKPSASKPRPAVDENDDDPDGNDLLSAEPPAKTGTKAAKNDADSEADEDLVEAALLDRRKSKSRAPSPPPPSAAEISREMMKHIGDAKKSEESPKLEKPKKKGGRGFGEGAPERPDETLVSSLVQTAKDMGPQLGLIVGGGIIAVFGIYWLSAGMWSSVKLPPLGRVTGVVTLNDQPLPGAMVTFIPLVDPKKNSKAEQTGNSVGMTDQQGKFSLQYSAETLGAVVGKHYVKITATDQAGHELVPDSYNVNSVLSGEVKAGSNPDVVFALKSTPREQPAKE
jgi:hypothetical protein